MVGAAAGWLEWLHSWGGWIQSSGVVVAAAPSSTF